MKKLCLLMLLILSFTNLKAVIVDTLNTLYFPISIYTAIASNDYRSFYSDGNFPTIYYLQDGEYTHKKIPFSADKYYFDFSNNLVGFDSLTFMINYYDFSKDTLLNYDLSELKIYNHYWISFFSSNYIGFVSKATNKALLFNIKTKELIHEFPEIDNSIYDNIFLSVNEKFIITFKGDTISKFNISSQETEYNIKVPDLFSNDYKIFQPNDSIMIFYDNHDLLTFDIKNGKIIYSEKDKARVGYYKRVYGDNQLLYFYTASDIIKPIFVNYFNGDTIIIENPELYKTETRKSIIAPYINLTDTLSARITEVTANNKTKCVFYIYSIPDQKSDTVYTDYVTDYTFYNYYYFQVIPRTKTFYNNSKLFSINSLQCIDTLNPPGGNDCYLLDSSNIIFRRQSLSNDSAVYIYNTETFEFDTVYKSKELCEKKQFEYNENFKINYNKIYNGNDYLINRASNDSIYSAPGLRISLQGTCFYHTYLDNNIKHLKIIIPAIDNSLTIKDFVLNDAIINNPKPNLSQDGKWIAFTVNDINIIYNTVTDKYDTLFTNFDFNINEKYFFNNSQYLQIHNVCYFDGNTGFETNSGFIVVDLNNMQTLLDFDSHKSSGRIFSSLNEDYAIILYSNKRNKGYTFYRFYQFRYDNSNIQDPVINKNSFSIYPNPSKTQLMISKSGEPLDNIDIYNAIGELIFSSANIYSNDFIIDTSIYPTGAYYIKSNNDTQMFVIER